MTPYIGVTGFMSRKEVEEVLEAFIHPRRLLMVGILASDKTIQESQSVEKIDTINRNRYPPVSTITNIFPSNCPDDRSVLDRVLNLVHFETSTNKPDTLLEQMEFATTVAGRRCNGLQLNVRWPNPEVLKTYRDRHPDKTIVLQIVCNGLSPKSLVHLIAKEYKHLFDYLLLDQSRGTGQPLNVERTREYLRALRDTGVEDYAGLCVAGGICVETIPELVAPLADEFPNLSVDMEGRVRNEYDHLDTSAASAAVDELSELFYPPRVSSASAASG